MSTIRSTVKPAAPPLPSPFAELAALPLVETDGVPLETPWHRAEINLLIEIILLRLCDRTDFYVGGNMFIYFSAEQVRNRDYRGPDFFFVNGVDRNRPRQWWAIWDEGGRYPNLIIELLSESTAEEDRTTKKNIYERIFRTPEYFLYDPQANELEGWRLNRRQRYRAIQQNDHGQMWSEELQLWLGPWDGIFQETHATWLRFFDSEGRLVPTEKEAERQRAEAERQRAEAERQRADAAESEVERLRRELEELRCQVPPKS